MKKILAFFCAFMFFPFVTGDGDSDIHFIESNGYLIPYIENASYEMREGYPLTPYFTKTYVFPFGTEIKGVDVKVKNVGKIEIDRKIMPSPPPLPLNGKGNGEAKEGEIYSKDVFYPEKWFDYRVGAGIKDGEHVVFLSIFIYPMRYNAVRNEIIYAEDFDVSIDYELGRGMMSNGEYDLLIITPSEWRDELQPLKEHKEARGIKTIIMDTEEIYSSYMGRDEAEEIKYAIKYALDHYGIKYVLLVGNQYKVPVRYSYAYDGEEVKFVSDLYYADIYDANAQFSSWDTNNNGYYGEYNHNGEEDEIDGYPDVYVGRIVCGSEAELETVINKIITYESTAPALQPWMEEAVGCGGDSHKDDEGVYEGEIVKEKAFSYLNDFTKTFLFTSDSTLSKSSIKKEFGEGAALFNFEGHGNRLSWATHPPNDFKTWIGFDVTDVTTFANGQKLPVVILSACECGQFDKGLCLAWQMVKVSNGGGIASFAATALSWGYIGKYATYGLGGYMDVLLCKNFGIGKHVGEMWGDSITTYINTQLMDSAIHYKTIEEWELFGDPSLKIGGYLSEEPIVYIEKPVAGYMYIGNSEIMKTLFGNTLVFGKIDIEVTAYNVEKVEFYIDGELKYTATEEPFTWTLDETLFGRHTIKVIGYGEEKQAEQEMDILIFNI